MYVWNRVLCLLLLLYNSKKRDCCTKAASPLRYVLAGMFSQY